MVWWQRPTGNLYWGKGGGSRIRSSRTLSATQWVRSSLVRAACGTLPKTERKGRRKERKNQSSAVKVSWFKPGHANLNSAKPLPIESTAHLTCHGTGKSKGARSHQVSKQERKGVNPLALVCDCYSHNDTAVKG